MFTKLHNAGYEQAENNNGFLSPESRSYSLDAIIALQKALENGIPEEIVEYASCFRLSFPKERRKLSDRRKAPSFWLKSGNSRLFRRMLRRLFSAMERSAEASGDGSSAPNAW